MAFDAMTSGKPSFGAAKRLERDVLNQATGVTNEVMVRVDVPVVARGAIRDDELAYEARPAKGLEDVVDRRA